MTYLEFRHVGHSSTGKTDVWRVVNTNDGSDLGQVSWYGAWRKYVFFCDDASIWSPDCLRQVAQFVDDQMDSRKQNRRLGEQVDRALEDRR